MVESIARQLWEQKLNTGSIPRELYSTTAERLMKGVFDGVGGKTFDYDDSRNALTAHLRHNVYSFSAAKSITELKHFNELQFDEAGQRRSWTAFRNAVYDAGYRFNETYLRAEWDNCEANAQMAVLWDELTAAHDYMEYRTVGDDRVRPAHARLDGLTLHKDSPVLRRIWPPCDWGCRCTMIPGIAANVRRTDAEAGALAKQVVTNPLFDNNPGLTKTIFKDNHPYFEHAGKTQQFDAVRNYGLPSLARLYAANDFPPLIIQDSKQAYYDWWFDQAKKTGDDILIRDRIGQNILFPSHSTTGTGKPADYFKDHIIRKDKEKRWEYASNFPDIMRDPDEIWSQRQNGKLVIYHVKYYEDGPYVVVSGDKNGSLMAETMYKLTREADIRRGALLFTK